MCCWLVFFNGNFQFFDVSVPSSRSAYQFLRSAHFGAVTDRNSELMLLGPRRVFFHEHPPPDRLPSSPLVHFRCHFHSFHVICVLFFNFCICSRELGSQDSSMREQNNFLMDTLYTNAFIEQILHNSFNIEVSECQLNLDGVLGICDFAVRGKSEFSLLCSCAPSEFASDRLYLWLYRLQTSLFSVSITDKAGQINLSKLLTCAMTACLRTRLVVKFPDTYN